MDPLTLHWTLHWTVPARSAATIFKFLAQSQLSGALNRVSSSFAVSSNEAQPSY